MAMKSGVSLICAALLKLRDDLMRLTVAGGAGDRECVARFHGE